VPAAQPPSVEARVATAADLEALTETMARAFHSDPVWAWAFPDPERRLAQHRAVWGLMIGAAIPHGSVWTLPGAAAAAVWIPPGVPELSAADEERLDSLVGEMLGPGAARVRDSFERFERAHPSDRGDHCYLSLLGTDPDHAGQGLGMGLLAANLARLDALGTAAYLESSNSANDARYERLGFMRCGCFELGEDGPRVTQMWRDPA
jgi:GNAT superfamily N-acetyltransferase